jgi:hypothetical protein
VDSSPLGFLKQPAAIAFVPLALYAVSSHNDGLAIRTEGFSVDSSLFIGFAAP